METRTQAITTAAGHTVNVHTCGRPGTATPLLCLHPVPHDGSFFGQTLASLGRHRSVLAPDYPGYGLSTALDDTPSIADYADALAAALLPDPPAAAQALTQTASKPVHLLGFHTGCLLAAELSLRYPAHIDRIVMIDIPLFSAARRAELLRTTDPTNPANRGFLAAFNYDCEERFAAVSHAGLIVATQSSLLEPTRAAARLLASMTLVERLDITRPVFETGGEALAQLVGGFLRG